MREKPDIKAKLFFDKDIWAKAIQRCIEKGVKPLELSEFTTAEFRAYLAEIMLEGKYKVAPPRIALIPKDNPGEFRKVYVNTVLDRLVLTIINEVYCILYGDLIHPRCVSYKKGTGVKDIIGNITDELEQSHGGYKIDISKYFDSVNRETMNAAINKVNTGSCIDQIVMDYYNEDLIIDENGQLQKKYKFLCQGCAPSAFFANLILWDVDVTLSQICPVYYRYSDDILFLGDRADEAMDVLSSLLSQKGLKINPKKVESISSDSWFTFLGCKIKGDRVSLGKKSLRNYISQIEKRTRLPKTKEYRHGCSKQELRKAIRSINSYLYLAYIKNSSQFGWGEYFFGIINCEEDIKAIDEWTKDVLRSYFTGKTNVGGLGSICTEPDKTVHRGKGRHVVSNRRKTEGLLEECGYVSMYHLYKCYRIDKEVYKSEVYRLMH